MQSINGDKDLIKRLTNLLRGGHAHAKTEDALANLPAKLRGVAPAGMPYSIWQLAEHIRIAQWDMLEFSRDPNHKSPKWPDEYWPKEKGPADDAAWEKCIEQIKEDRESFINMLNAKDADLFTPFPHGDGQNLLHEALLIGDHASYHTGEIIVMRRILGAWNS